MYQRLILCLFLLATALAGAQENPLPLTILSGRATLATKPEVQAALLMSPAQMEQVRAKIEGGAKVSVSGQAGSVPALELLDSQVKPIFTEDQWTRLDQLWMQYEGPFVLQNSDVADKLELSEEVREKIAKVAQDYGTWLQGQLPRVRRGEDLKRIQREARKYGGKMLALLKPEQKKKFIEMQGPKFKFKN